MSIRTPRAFTGQVKAIGNFGELNRWATSINDTVVDSVQSLNDIALALRKIMNTTTPTVVLAPHAHTHLPLGTDPLATAAPSFVFGTAAAVGVANSLVRSDASLAIFDGTTPPAVGTGATGVAAFAARSDHTHSLGASSFAVPALTFTTSNAAGAAATAIRTDASIAIFDATVPSNDAATASAGSAAFAARRDHVHQFPSALLETTNSKKVTLTSTTTISTLTTDVASLRLAGATSFAPSSTNAIDFGSAVLLWKSGRFGTGGLTTTGNLSVSGSGSVVLGFTTDVIPNTNLVQALGDPTHNWAGVYAASVLLTDITTPTFHTAPQSNSSVALTTDRAFNIDVTDGDRTIKLTGNPTLDDWFDQAVKQASNPQFTNLTLTGTLSVQGNTTIGNATTDTVKFFAGGNASAPSTNAIGVIVDYFGTSATRVLTTPNRWWSIIADDGNTYKIALYS